MLLIAEYNLKEHLRQVADDRSNRKKEIENEMRILWRSYRCLSSALGYLYANEIRHRDIKPSNILVERGNVLLTDFGRA
jgi:serine/threonine protein kinase